MRPSPFLSSNFSRPVFSQRFIQSGRSSALMEASGAYRSPPAFTAVFTVPCRFSLAMAATAGAVVYRMAMKISAQPAEERASLTEGTVKNRMITWGRPAVPIISDRVYTNMFSVLPAVVVVYLPKPRSTTTWSNLASRLMSVPEKVPPKPNWGRGLPVSCREMKMAGMVYAKISTMY